MSERVVAPAAAVRGSRVGGAWDAFADGAAYFFQTPAWIEALAPHLGADVAVGALLDGDRPRAVTIVHRRVRRIAGIPLTVLSEVTPDPEEPPLADGIVDGEAGVGLRELAGVTGRWDVLLIRRLRARSPWLALAAGEASVVEEPDFGVAVLDTAAPFAERWPAMPRNLRASIRNARNRMAATGAVETAVATGDEVGPAYDRYVDMEVSGWKGEAGTALASRPWLRDMHRGFLLASADARVYSLTVGGRMAAALYGVVVARTFFAIHTTFDEGLRALSPGSVVLADVIEHCCEDPGVDRVDCCVWNDWLARWGMEREPTYTVAAFARGPRGRMAQLHWWLEHRGER